MFCGSNRKSSRRTENQDRKGDQDSYIASLILWLTIREIRHTIDIFVYFCNPRRRAISMKIYFTINTNKTHMAFPLKIKCTLNLIVTEEFLFFFRFQKTFCESEFLYFISHRMKAILKRNKNFPKQPIFFYIYIGKKHQYG